MNKLIQPCCVRQYGGCDVITLTINQNLIIDDDAIDYENPIDGTPPGADYDNPPINSKSGKGSSDSSDYDNPPVQGALEKSSDYDNPPPVEGGDSESNEYKVPKSDLIDHEDGQDGETTAF